jgi:hypothetical protein
MLFARIHATTSPHTTSKSQDGSMKAAIASKSLHQGETAVTDDLSQFDQTALLILPSQEDNEPMLEQNPDQFGIQLA